MESEKRQYHILASREFPCSMALNVANVLNDEQNQIIKNKNTQNFVQHITNIQIIVYDAEWEVNDNE
jgi:hypothetical protein